jgi:putative oxidoreductase
MTSAVQVIRTSTDFGFRVLAGIVWPKFELLTRLWLAKIFFTSGMLKVMHWDVVVYVATSEYPVRMISPAAAATVGASIEMVGASLLAVGFMTRYAALPLFLLTVVTQIAYPHNSQLFWLAILGWLVIYGAGFWSMDRLLRRGLGDSALPLIPLLIRISARIRKELAPAYLSTLRVWLGLTLVAAVNQNRTGTALPLESWFPLDIAQRMESSVAWVGGIFLLAGLGTRFAALSMMLLLFADSMMDPRMTDAMYLLMVLSRFTVYGGGGLSIDSAIAWLLSKRFPVMNLRDSRRLLGLPRVVIVGAGFAGIRCAAGLRTTRTTVTLIDRTNYHLFQPLLYQVATAGLSPSDIATPVRQVFRDTFGVRVLLGSVTAVDSTTRCVVADGEQIPYDYLVLATGATHSYFGKESWAPYAPGLKRLEDAIDIRRRILTAFERAELTHDHAERTALLTFLMVGGGPTGVELAGAIAELARFGMNQDFRAFNPADAKVVLVQSATRLLPSFPEALARVAQRSLERLGVEVILGSRVEHIDDAGVAVSGSRIAARTVIWAAGVKASPAAEWLHVPADSAGRVKVDAALRVASLDNVFAIGDTACSQAWNGRTVPGLAPAAKQGGAYVAKVIRAAIEGRPAPPAFKYRHLGNLATIGRKSAVVEFGGVQLWGTPAWWLWGILHVGFLVGLRNRVATLVNWFWAYLTFGGGIRLITAASANPAIDAIPANPSAVVLRAKRPEG